MTSDTSITKPDSFADTANHGKIADIAEKATPPQHSNFNAPPPSPQPLSTYFPHGSFPHLAPVQGLYLHIPFCFHKCHYCDFYSIVDAQTTTKTTQTKPPPAHTSAAPNSIISKSINAAPESASASPTDTPRRQQAFVDRIIAELKFLTDHFDLKPRTIFAGGGTPTLLAPQAWQQILGEMNDQGILHEVEEFTTEANPETVTPQLLKTMHEGGVNRISIGAQSFQPDLLKTLERWHDPTTVPPAIQYARDAGITNINLDLIFAIPGQTLSTLDADIDTALALEPTHISYYSLIYEPNTAMTQRLKQGKVNPIAEELEREMFTHVMARLAAAGYEHYEISNWAKCETSPSNSASSTKQAEAHKLDNYRCLHNLLYWRNENWLGVGPSASSHVLGHRWKNVANLGQYLEQAATATGESTVIDVEHLPLAASIGEQLMLRLRLLEGVDSGWLQQNLPADDPRWQTIEHLLNQGMLKKNTSAGTLQLTSEGLYLADAVMAELL